MVVYESFTLSSDECEGFLESHLAVPVKIVIHRTL